MNPKTFISHASEDKDRFVIDFSSKLRSKGIDAWLDKWEMFPGDSLVDKIFEEGIKNADAFVIILSQHSVNKPWVREELNAGFVKRISIKTKIIPIVIDDCEVPECLKSTLWERIQNLESYDENLNRIVQSIFGISEKPQLGKPPKHIKTVIDVLPGLTKVDTIIFNQSCKITIEKGDKNINLSEIYDSLKEYGISDDEIEESLEILDSRGFIKAQRVLKGRIPFFLITQYGFDLYARKNINDYDLIVKEVCLKILNENLMVNHQIAEATNTPIALINHILETIERKGLVKTIKALNGLYQVHYVSPELKRMFR
ncbi:toll/interleukin-1 receptor domain-containing protein [Desulfobacula toluolica]|uniref:Predicted Toll-interleukin receptor domain protein n=1 Tax=Desulfobacula toluolica (strain DSM 7467 / Tol2) TaxID=651182 RepID=K0NTM2_DESTT|nr:toll/interleukin-1 receptor domain-containing protein [Desulfobacula toluolica]CCK82427.1 predicted Toll-interleukin receptor domain protein [Desulfobacula toluolica Tol2]